MSDATPDISDSRPQGSVAAGEPDPFLTLHKMSTTAGLGSGDYVAINGTAIAALLLGIVSALVLFGLLLLLLLPLAGVVCGILAFRQISDSNGTQTGRGLAGLGLLLSLGFGGFVISKQGIETARNRSDEAQVAQLLGQLEAAVKSEKYDDAYQLCDDHFKQRVSQTTFVERWKAGNGSSFLGRITSIQSKLLKFETDLVTDERVSNSLVLFSFEKIKGMDRQGMIFRKLGGRWMIDDMPSMFPPENPQQGRGAASGRQPVAVPSLPQGPPAPK